MQYASSYKAIGHRPGSCEEFTHILEKCLKTEGVHVIDLAVDYTLNHAILNDLLTQKECLI